MDPLKSLGTFKPAQKAVSFWEEFKDFAFKGSVIDLAVGVIIGGAFGGIVKSLVQNVIMPFVGLLLPEGQTYEKWGLEINDKTIPIGAFIGDVVNFLILALVLYVFIVKFLGWLVRAKQAEAAGPPKLTTDQELLTEIRDLLQKNAGKAG